MSDEHVHRWSAWTTWAYYSGSLDVRERYCGEHTDTETRPHVHDWVPQSDPFAPVGSGFTVDVCSDCHEPRR